MVKIYALMSGEEVLYVGQTCRSLRRRESAHRCSSNDCGSRHIPSDVQWVMQLLEECEEEHANEWERFYIEMYAPPYNKKLPGRTDAEYRKTNIQKAYQKAYHKEYQKKYRQTKAREEYMRAYRLRQKAIKEREQQKPADHPVGEE